MADWYSSKCALTWKMKGTKFNRLLFQLVPKTLRTEEKEFGLLPTPTAMQDDADPEKVDARNEKQLAMGNPKFILGLTQMAKRGMLPTPTAVQRDHPERVEKLKASGATDIYSRNNGENRPNSILDYMNFHGMLPTANAAEGYKSAKTYNPNSQMGTSLSAMAGSGMLPTPTVADSKHSTTKSDSWDKRIEQKHLAETVLNPFIEKKGGKTSQLNPRFVAEMMGFPHNWTELPFQSGEQSQSKDTATP